MTTACGRIGYEAIGSADASQTVPDASCTTPAAASWAIPNGGIYAAGITVTIGTDTPGATICVTTDGSAPSTSSPSAVGLVTSVTPVPGQPVRYQARNGCAVETPSRSEAYTVDTSLQSALGFLASDISLADGSPVAVVSPGAAIAGSGTFQYWYYSGCPSCITQVVYGIEDVAAGCAVNDVPGVWPGMTMSGTITLTAPSTPGTYAVYGKVTTQFGCDSGAYAAYAASAVADGRKLGVIVVR